MGGSLLRTKRPVAVMHADYPAADSSKAIDTPDQIGPSWRLRGTRARNCLGIAQLDHPGPLSREQGSILPWVRPPRRPRCSRCVWRSSTGGRRPPGSYVSSNSFDLRFTAPIDTCPTASARSEERRVG